MSRVIIVFSLFCSGFTWILFIWSFFSSRMFYGPWLSSFTSKAPSPWSLFHQKSFLLSFLLLPLHFAFILWFSDPYHWYICFISLHISFAELKAMSHHFLSLRSSGCLILSCTKITWKLILKNSLLSHITRVSDSVSLELASKCIFLKNFVWHRFGQCRDHSLPLSCQSSCIFLGFTKL